MRAEDDDVPWSNLDGTQLDILMSAAGGISAEGSQDNEVDKDWKKRRSRKGGGVDDDENVNEFNDDNDDNDSDNDSDNDDDDDDDDVDSCALLPSGPVGGDGVTGEPIDWSNSWRGWPSPLHAKLATWADAFLVLPLDVSTLGAAASGYSSEPGPCGCLVSRTLRAWPAAASAASTYPHNGGTKDSDTSDADYLNSSSINAANGATTVSSSSDAAWNDSSNGDHDDVNESAVCGKPLLIGLGLAPWEAKSPATVGAHFGS